MSGGRNYRLNWEQQGTTFTWGPWTVEWKMGLWQVFLNGQRYQFGSKMASYGSPEAAMRKVEREIAKR